MTRWVLFAIASVLGALAGLLSVGLLSGAVMGIFAACFTPRIRSLWFATYLVANLLISFGIPRSFVGLTTQLALLPAAVSTILFFWATWEVKEMKEKDRSGVPY